MYDSTFTPSGPTTLVGVTALQIPAISPNEVQATSYRVRCLVSGYLTWNPVIASNATPTITATAPVAGTPSANTIGMSAGTVETFCLPQNAWFIANAAAAFEVTPGEGM